jgi:hypothetical protein
MERSWRKAMTTHTYRERERDREEEREEEGEERRVGERERALSKGESSKIFQNTFNI